MPTKKLRLSARVIPILRNNWAPADMETLIIIAVNINGFIVYDSDS